MKKTPLLIHILIHLIDAKYSHFMHGWQLCHQYHQKNREVDGKSPHIVVCVMRTQQEATSEDIQVKPMIQSYTT